MLLQSGEKYSQIKHCLHAKTVHNNSKICQGFLMWGQRGMGITGGSVIMDYGLLFCPEATVINALIMDLCFLQIHSFSLHKTLIDGLESCGLLVGNCDVLISWTVILTAPIHCRGSTSEQVMLNFSKSALMQKNSHLHFGWPEDEQILIFVWTIPIIRQSGEILLSFLY